ncbi:MAG: DUF362 domain-containing protein [Deltaproteobacteria bacterium]|nr:DUF362 domain-containing protein [Deltaproteobacteria bacterium]
MKPVARPRVILRHCDTYDAERIRVLVREGLEELDLAPFGRTLVKPNLVAAGEFFPHAHTRVEVAEGVLRALQDRATESLTELAIGERCGITVPTRLVFRDAGYDDMLTRLPGVKRYLFEETQQREIRYTHRTRLRDYVFTPEPVAKADFFVNMPKFKAHPWTTVTFGCKNYIGIQDDRHRLIDHDHRLDEKIRDLQYIVQPQFLVIDAIVAGEGRMLTPKPRRLNLIIMGDNQLAFDAVCCAIAGVNPREVPHLRLAFEEGFGPLDLSEITLSGDVTLEQAKARAEGFEVGLVRVEKYFEGTNITAYAGPPPEKEHTDYCWGGCPGAVEEAIEIIRQYDSECDAKMPRMHIVFGAYEGPIDAKEGEKVIFIGDCAQWKGELKGELVSVESLYRDRATKDPHEAKHSDIYEKMLSIYRKVHRESDAPAMRLEGCPVSVAEQVLALVALAKLKNPFFDPKQAVGFNRAYLSWRGLEVIKRVVSQEPYQKAGPCSRGRAAPSLSSTASNTSPENAE